MVNIDARNLELEDRVVAINRVTKVVKGGRRLRFAALVVILARRPSLVHNERLYLSHPNRER